MSSQGKIIIIKKRKAAAHGHHGGSWKVAYADFVTAMMAFFMVMWIMGMDQGVKDMVQGYFENPVGFRRGFSGGRNILSQGNSITSLELRRTVLLRRRVEEEQRLSKAARNIDLKLSEVASAAELGDAVEVVVTDLGLRIEMMETGNGVTFFDRSSADLSPRLEEVLALIASQISELPNGVVVEGHTDAHPFGGDSYSNFELSSDRANAARRVLIAAGLPANHIVEVRAHADRHLKVVENPVDERNRRISLLLPFDSPTIDELTAEELRAATDIVEGLEFSRRRPPL